MPDAESGMAGFRKTSAENLCYFVFTGALNFGPK
jgi:hypothetical protein